MDKREKVIGHLEDCMDVAERTPHEWVFVRVEIVRDALELLKTDENWMADYRRWHANQKNTIKKLMQENEQRKRLEVHNIGNVDIPEGVTTEQFHAAMNNVVKALEHTDRGESWPYEEVK